MDHSDDGHVAPATEIAELVLDLVPRMNRWAEVVLCHEDPGHGSLSLRQLLALELIGAESLNASQLAERLLVTAAVVTGLIDRLERYGYVERVPRTDDRRCLDLVRTSLGAEVCEGVVADFVAHISPSLRTLSNRESEILDESMKLLSRVVSHLETQHTRSVTPRWR